MTYSEHSIGPSDQSTSFDSASHYSELMAELDKLSANAHERLKAEDKLERKIEGSKLPEVLFHATEPVNTEAITAQGLLPSQLMEEGHPPVVSLSDTATFALDVAAQTTGVPRDQLEVIEVTTRGLNREDFRSYLQLTAGEYAELAGVQILEADSDNQLHEVHFTGEDGIDPDFLHQLSRDELEQELAREAKLS